MTLLNVFLQLFVVLHELLRKTLSNLLGFLSYLDQTARIALRAVSDFSWKMGRIMLSVVWTTARLALFYLPGIVPVVFFRTNTILFIGGIVYMVMITAVGIFYRPGSDSTQPARVNVTWLSFFPLSWAQDKDFAPILAEFTNSHNDLRLSLKSADNELVRGALGRVLSRLEQNMKWTSTCVGNARKLRKLQKRIKDSRMVADLETRIQSVKERLMSNLIQFREAKTELGQVNLALDDQDRVFDSLNPIEDEIVLLEQFRKVLRGHA